MTCPPCEPTPAVDRANSVRCDVATLLAEGASALEHTGDLKAARRRFDAAFREAERTGDAEAMAEAALGMGGLWVHEDRTLAGSTLLTQRLHQAMSAVDHRSALGLRLRIRLAGEAGYRDSRPTAVLALLDEAAETGDPLVRADALSIAHHCLLSPEHGRLRRKLAVELVGESFRTRRRSDLLMGLLWRVIDLLLAGDSHAGRRLVELKEMLSREDHLAVGFVVSAIDVMLAIRTGELGRAESLAKACAQRGEAAGDIDATGWYGAQLVAIRWYQGRVVETLPMLTELVDSPTLSTVDYGSLAALAVAAAVAGDRPRAASALARLCGHDLADLPRSSSWLATMNGIVETADLLADTRTAARAYELLSPYAHLPMVGSLGVVCFGSVHHALAVASLTTGDLDRAIEHLRSAVQQNLALAHWPAVVASRRRLAQALTQRGRPQDIIDAEHQRTAATAEAAPLDITPSGGDELASTHTASCTRHGRHWRVTLGNRSVLVGHRIGMFYLAVLIANPGQEIDAVDLAAGPSALRPARNDSTSSQPLLDPVARREYQRRLAQLRADIERLEARNEAELAARATAERDWILSELSAAAGVGGRARGFPTNRERARTAVGKAIRRGLEQISKSDPVVGAHLTQTIRTGVRCSYWPV